MSSLVQISALAYNPSGDLLAVGDSNREVSQPTTFERMPLLPTLAVPEKPLAIYTPDEACFCGVDKIV
jgi:hypothetical protein